VLLRSPPKSPYISLKYIIMSKIIKLLETKIGERVSQKLIDELKALNATKNDKNKALDKAINSGIYLWLGEKQYTRDALLIFQLKHKEFKNLSTQKFIASIKRVAEQNGFFYTSFKNPKRGFEIKEWNING